MKKVAKMAFCIGLIMIALVYAPVQAGAADSVSIHPEEIQAAMISSAQSLGLQTQLPAAESGLPAEENPARNSPTRRIDIPGVAAVLFFAALIAIGVVIFMTWRDNLWSSSRSRTLHSLRSFTPGDNNSISEFAAWEERSRAEADELARCGNFAEAMRVLLLRSVEELRRHLRVSIAASLTSREILRHVSMPSEGRPVLADIIGRVEVSYFGGHRPGADEYKACRDSFDALTNVLRRHSTSGEANAFMTP